MLQEVEITLFHLPKPTKHHLDTLEQLLIKIEKDFSLSNADLQSRASIEIKLDAILKKFIPGKGTFINDVMQGRGGCNIWA